MGFVFLGIMIACFVYFTVRLIKELRDTAIKSNEGIVYHIKCDKCGNERESDFVELTKHKMSKTRSRTVNANVGGVVGVGVTHYDYFGKKCYCETCGKNTWHDVLNYNEHAMRNTKEYLPAVFKYFATLFCIGIAMSFISRIIEFFTK